MLLLQIVSIEEIMRRKSMVDIESYLPLPQLSADSCVLTEDHLRQVNDNYTGSICGVTCSVVLNKINDNLKC